MSDESPHPLLKTWSVGTYFKVPVGFHFTWFLIPALIFFPTLAQTNSFLMSLGLTAIMLPIVLFTVIAHEFGHVLMARRLGYETQMIVIHALGGAAFIKMPLQLPSKQEILVSGAGPAVNFMLSILLLPLTVLLPSPIQDFLMAFMLINVMVGIFNLLPIYPMDGAKVLNGILTLKFSRLFSKKIVSCVSIFFAVLLVSYGFYSANVAATIIAVMLLVKNYSDLANANNS